MSIEYFMMLPPAAGGATTLPNGRIYVGVAGTPQAIPYFDATLLTNKGWSLTTNPNVKCGATTARPANPKPGEMFLDTTLGYVITYNQPLGAWINPATGATV